MTTMNSQNQEVGAALVKKKVKRAGGPSDVYTGLLALALAALAGATVVVCMKAQAMFGEIFRVVGP